MKNIASRNFTIVYTHIKYYSSCKYFIFEKNIKYAQNIFRRLFSL